MAKEYDLMSSPTQKQYDRQNISRLEGVWTPTLTCTTPGDLDVTYSVADSGYYYTLGQLIFVRFQMATSFTHTTAAGTIKIEGLPEHVINGFQPTAAPGIIGTITGAIATATREQRVYGGGGNVTINGYTKANYTHAYLNPVIGTTYMTVIMSGSGVSRAPLEIADLPSGGVTLDGFAFYTRLTVT